MCALTLPYLLCIPDQTLSCQTNQPALKGQWPRNYVRIPMYALLLEISVYSFLIFLLYGDQLRRSSTKLMGRFWVTKNLCFKAILKCEAIDMKMLFFLFSCKYSITHFEFHKHLGSFWKWEFLELGNYFVIRLSVYLSCARDVYKIWASKRRETWGDFHKKRRPEIRQCAFAGYPVSKCQEQVKRIALKKDFFFERSRMSSFSLVS